MGQSNKESNYTYSKFSKIDGRHPLQQSCPNSFVFYRTRTRKSGKVVAFNFELAKEIGLIPSTHPNSITPELEQSFLDTFAIVIINEYDIENEIEFPKEEIRPHMYMATRYLQMQHPNKQGKTSGDGRSIWNGQLSYKGKSYDISSCGTGATKLSPATSIHGKNFQTGSPEVSYGCGYSETDEGFSSLFFSEVLHKNKIKTERVLGVIEFPGGLSINVRVHENLLRPSHFFNHLKQGNYEALKDITQYYIDKEIASNNWRDAPKTLNARYKYFLNAMSETFAKMSACFEDEYLFCWLEWDGDNILMDGSIIDYGSVRQFGLYHDEYRYDDVEQYSTTIKEQKKKARYIVQNFAQAIDFLITKNKKNISEFSDHAALKEFDKIFFEHKYQNLLKKIGLRPEWIDFLYPKNLETIEGFLKSFSYFEKAKSSKGIYEISDGITRDAIFCMRDILRELPQLLLSRGEYITSEEFIEIIKSSYATEGDLELSSYRETKVKEFQQQYLDLVKLVAQENKCSEQKILLEIVMRSSVINKYDRVTGDSITQIVDLVLKNKNDLKIDGVFDLLQDFTSYQNLDPDAKDRSNPKVANRKIVRQIFDIVNYYRESL